jgi:hypothetical protein
LNAQAEPDHLSGARSAHHYAVACTLDHLGPVLRSQSRHGRGEIDRKLGRRPVADALRDGGIATQIGEEEALELLIGHL